MVDRYGLFCNYILKLVIGRISSVGRAFDCRAGGRGFDSRGRTITQGLKMTEKWRYFLCTASGETFGWLGWPRKMAVPVSIRRRKIVLPIRTFMLNTFDTQIKSAFFLKVKSLPFHIPEEITLSGGASPYRPSKRVPPPPRTIDRVCTAHYRVSNSWKNLEICPAIFQTWKKFGK